jgi:hypothetical protein
MLIISVILPWDLKKINRLAYLVIDKLDRLAYHVFKEIHMAIIYQFPTGEDLLRMKGQYGSAMKEREDCKLLHERYTKLIKLGLPPKTIYHLAKMGVSDLPTLLALDLKKLGWCRGIGNKTMEKLRAAIAALASENKGAAL